MRANWKPLDEATFRALYLDQGWGLRAITRAFGVPYRSLRRMALHWGVPLRSKSDAVALQWVGNDDRRANQSTRFGAMRRTQTLPPLSPEARARISASKRGDLNPAKRPDVRLKMAATMRARVSADPSLHINALMARNHRESRLQRIVGEAIEAAGVSLLRAQRVGRLWPDFIVTGKPLIIEVDGARWHTDPAKDRARDAVLAQQGYAVLHLTDDEWDADPDQVIAKALAFIAAQATQ